jgi:hypothetical protein
LKQKGKPHEDTETEEKEKLSGKAKLTDTAGEVNTTTGFLSPEPSMLISFLRKN